VSYLFALVVGVASGMSSGLFGVGGGVVMVPAFILLLGTDMKRAVGTSLAVVVPTAVISAWKHQGHGNIDWGLATKLIPAAVVGGFLGAWLTQHISAGGLKKAFAVFMIGVGVYLLFSDRLGTSSSRPSVKSL